MGNIQYRSFADPSASLLDVRFEGVVDIDTRLTALRESLRLIVLHDLQRVVIDYRSATLRNDSFEAASHFATTMASAPQLRRCRVAFVGARAQSSNFLVESMTLARGLQTQRFFDRETALAWLAERSIAERPLVAASRG